MKREELLDKQNKMLICLTGLPKKILSLHGAENVTEFVLHDLCNECCFNLSRAAYFVDNPDFNCTKGIAGFCRDEIRDKCSGIWDDPQAFSRCMQSSLFNQKVRHINEISLKNAGYDQDVLAKKLAEDLDFKHYTYCSWTMKHDNNGFVIFEKAEPQETFADEHVLSGVTLLSFCPIF
jgi:hypothetical protein